MIYRAKNTVMVLEDCYPSVQKSEISFIKQNIADMGYFVKTVKVSDFVFSNKNFPDYFADVLIVPDCQNLPIEAKEALKNYNENHGSVVFIGGPLFYNRVESVGDKYEKIPLNDTLDANFASENPYVREGIAPSYKVFSAKGIDKLKAADNQYIFSGDLSIPQNSEVIIPCETNHGLGYDTDANCRFISLADCFDNSDKDDILEIGLRNGNRGSFSYIELENTQGLGYCGRVNYGMVESTQVGSAVAVIGYNNGIQNIKGSDKLLKSVISSLKRGLFLFEGGCNGLVFRNNDDVTFGAKVLNTASEFKKVSVEFCVDFENSHKKYTFEKLISPKSLSDVHFTLDFDTLKDLGIKFEKDYAVTVLLIYDNAIIDKIISGFSFEKELCETDDKKYVKTAGDKFYLDGKPWFMAGMNYWPTHSQSKEKRNYWFGFCDKSNYDYITVENDLCYMEKIGINCVITRIDFTDFERCIHGVRDFIKRCERHDIKIGIALTKATATRFFNKEALIYMLKNINIANNPAVAFIDIEWESACDPFRTVANAEYNDDWEKWLINRYKTVKNAQKELDVVFEYDIFGYPFIPKPSNKKITAEICEFSENATNGFWNNCIDSVRELFPNQLVTFRYGTAYPRGKAHASKFIDFSALEIYDFNGFDKFSEKDYRDNCVGLCVASCAIQSYETHNKPIVWAEYGRSSCGIKWHNELFYDHENRSYLEREVKYQTLYNRLVQEAAEESCCAGMAPWWWCGGFRYTELADFGYVSPSGKLNDSGKSYVLFCEKMKRKINEKDDRKEYCIEENIYNFSDAKNEFVENTGIAAYKKAKAENKKLVIKTKYVQE